MDKLSRYDLDKKSSQTNIDQEDMSSSSFSSASRASLEHVASSSPTASYSGENLMPFYSDSSGSL